MASQDDVLWEAQRDVFSSVERHLASVINFHQLLPDLLRLRFFTDEQLARHNRFCGVTSDVIIAALSERVSVDRHVFPLFLVTLRRVNSALVDELHQKVSTRMAQGCVASNQLKESNSDDITGRQLSAYSGYTQYRYC